MHLKAYPCLFRLILSDVEKQSVFGKLSEHFRKSFEKLSDGVKTNNWIFLLVCALVIALIIASAVIIEVLISKKTGIPRKNDKLKIKRMIIIAVFAAIADVLMALDFPIWFAPGFLKMDFSEIPVLIAALALGPVAGITTEFIKVVLNLFINGTVTAFVGEFANFIVGCAFIIPVSALYYQKKTRKRALTGLVTGTFAASLLGALLNAYLLIPKYMQLFHMDLSSIVAMGSEKNAAVTNLSTLILWAIIPFNLMKFALVSLIVALIYKYISRLIKEQ